MFSSARMARPYLAILSILLLLTAVAITAWNFWPEISWYLGLVPEVSEYEAPDGVFDGEPSTDDTSTPDAEQPSNDEGGGSTGPPRTGNRLVIPRIGVDIGIYEGNAEQAIEWGAYRHISTGRPGDGQEVVIAGHRVARALALLHRLAPGDTILVYWGGYKYRYKVTGKYVAEPDDPQILANASTETLRVYTCTPRYQGNRRVVVNAAP